MEEDGRVLVCECQGNSPLLGPFSGWPSRLCSPGPNCATIPVVISGDDGQLPPVQLPTSASTLWQVSEHLITPLNYCTGQVLLLQTFSTHLIR